MTKPATAFLFALLCAASAPLARADVQLQLVTSGLASPVAIANAGDGTGRLFIVEQGGRIRIWSGSLAATPFLDIHGSILAGGERGLLGLAFHPQYASNGRFFVYYTDLTGTLTIAEYHVSGDPNVADPLSGQVLLSIPHPNFSNHNGGNLAFGPDGYLYAGTGDGGSGGDPDGNGQNLGSLLGKLLRLDVDGPSLIPPSNPFVDGNPATRDEIWAYGLRNPWRFSFDRQNGDLFIGDVGQGCWEEIDYQRHGEGAGANYGWNAMEGNKCYDPPSCTPPPTCVDSGFTLPIATYPHGPDCSVTGGYRYRGTLVPSLSGVYLFGDYCSGVIRAANPGAGDSWTSATLLDTDLSITSFGEDEQGEVYVADGGGGIYRFAPSTVPFSDDFEDGDAGDWTGSAGAWSVLDGELTSAPGRRARILAPNTPCTLCTVEATVTPHTAGADVILLGWWRSAGSHVEAVFSEDRDRVILRALAGGEVVAHAAADLPIAVGDRIDARLVDNGSRISLYLGVADTPILTIKARKSLHGIAGFEVRGSRRSPASGSMDRIEVF
jgi:glucose/arabinose dehydrogenase